jgi:enterochelin esterase-like enzyme
VTKKTLPVLASIAAAAAAAAALAGTGGSRDVDAAFVSQAIGTLHFRIYLPPGYDDTTMRYPVVYFLHGLPAGSGSYRSLGFVRRALEAAGRPALLVTPQGATAGNADPEYVGGWEQAIADELPRVVDRRFRTIASRDGRALIGVSAGGYGAMHLALRHLDEFAVVESWSGYFHPTDPSGTKPLDLGSAAQNRDANVHAAVPQLTQRLSSRPTFIAFYVGRGDWRFYPENVALHRELVRAGVRHLFRVYAGGHSTSLWTTHAPAWLALALDHLAAPHP